MTPERWARVQEVFVAALELPLTARRTFVVEACVGDPELGREVDSLLQSHDDASMRFLESPVVSSNVAALRRSSLIGARLGPYVILAPLGSGGMGEVYRARDGKLDRDVAIKVLPAQLSSNPEALARFEREAKAVAALSHQNILAIHDFGSQDGVTYAVTELLDGETLRSKLDAGALPRRDALDYARQIARGLAAAHERGIVHRDLKPENLFVARDGHVKILDFGLAKRDGPEPAGEVTSAPTVSGQTQPGTVMGTVGYMSPEQVRGLAADHRTDVFSFGVVLYEMLCGERAFKRETAADTMSAILKEEPPEIRGGAADSLALDRVVRRCLEKDRERRFQSARDVEFALSDVSSAPSVPVAARPLRNRRGLVAATVVGALAVGAASLWIRPSRSSTPSVKRIAVLPFENLGPAEDDYLADGMSDEVRGKLTMLPEVGVIARGSSTPYRRTKKSPQEIAKELGVSYILTGTVRWQKGADRSTRVVVRPELVEISDAGAPTSKWQQPFDAAFVDAFAVQSEIASRVAQSLGVALGATDQRRLEATPTANLDAYDLFLKGEQAWMDRDDAREGRGYYQRAVDLDPGFARAWSRLSTCDSHLFAAAPDPKLATSARTASGKALSLSPESGDAQLALGVYLLLVRQDYKGALNRFAVGQSLEPSNADLLGGRGNIEMVLGRWQDAVEHEQAAERLNPRSPDAKIWLATALIMLRRFPEAGAVLDRGLALAPDNMSMIATKVRWFLSQGDIPSARTILAKQFEGESTAAFVAFVASWFGPQLLDEEEKKTLLGFSPEAFNGDRAEWGMALAATSHWRGDSKNTHRYAEEARAAIESRLEHAPESPDLHANLGLALAYLARRDEAIREGERALALAPARDGQSGIGMQGNLAGIYVVLGEHEKAIDRIERLMTVPSGWTAEWLKNGASFAPLRGNPRFERLIASQS